MVGANGAVGGLGAGEPVFADTEGVEAEDPTVEVGPEPVGLAVGLGLLKAAGAPSVNLF